MFPSISIVFVMVAIIAAESWLVKCFQVLSSRFCSNEFACLFCFGLSQLALFITRHLLFAHGLYGHSSRHVLDTYLTCCREAQLVMSPLQDIPVYGTTDTGNGSSFACHSGTRSPPLEDRSGFDIDGALRQYWKTMTQKVCHDTQYKSCNGMSR
jgi:hypothetical protein